MADERWVDYYAAEAIKVYPNADTDRWILCTLLKTVTTKGTAHRRAYLNVGTRCWSQNWDREAVVASSFSSARDALVWAAANPVTEGSAGSSAWIMPVEEAFATEAHNG